MFFWKILKQVLLLSKLFIYLAVLTDLQKVTFCTLQVLKKNK